MFEAQQNDILARVICRAYALLGRKYAVVIGTAQILASLVVTWLTIVILSMYFNPDWRDTAWVLVAGTVATTVAVGISLVRGNAKLRQVTRWKEIENPTERQTTRAWKTATTFLLLQYRRDSWFVNIIAIVPIVWASADLWNLDLGGVLAIGAVSAVPALYATTLSYSIGEVLMRPIVSEIALALPDDFDFESQGVSIATRLAWGVRIYTTMTGLATAGVLLPDEGARGLLIASAVSVVFGLALSHELITLLLQSINRPIATVREQLEQVRAGDFTGRVQVLSSDELGQLANDFNKMVLGLAEREEIREAFGTYMDHDVAAVILDGAQNEGVEMDVSVLFCDVRGFTSYAEQHSAAHVIAVLNELFEAIVPVVNRHAGHVDKFLGDGLLAVFGAPVADHRHADRAVAAGEDILAVVDRLGLGLSMGVGINSGPVIAGPIGGAGRLNYSVIGDVVNTAARVEAATRRTGDDLLITAATRDRLTHPVSLVSRGTVELKGKAEALEVFTPLGSDAGEWLGRAHPVPTRAPGQPAAR